MIWCVKPPGCAEKTARPLTPEEGGGIIAAYDLKIAGEKLPVHRRAGG